MPLDDGKNPGDYLDPHDRPTSPTINNEDCPLCKDPNMGYHLGTQEYHNLSAAKEWDQSEDNPNKPIVTFNALLEQTTILMIAMKSTLRKMGSLSNADQSDLLILESQILVIEQKVLWVKQFFAELEIGAS